MSFIVYVWRGTKSVGVISTEDEAFIESLKKWADLEGYLVTTKSVTSQHVGPKHK